MAETERGRIEAIHVAAAAGQPLHAVEAVGVTAHVGLAGDRYGELATGRYSNHASGKPRGITLIEGEELDRLADTTGIRLDPGQSRRNLTTRGIRLNELVGRTFKVGSIRVRGLELCEPCEYLQGHVGQPILAPLVHRAGLRGDPLDDGEIRVGDAIEIAIESASA